MWNFLMEFSFSFKFSITLILKNQKKSIIFSQYTSQIQIQLIIFERINTRNSSDRIAPH